MRNSKVTVLMYHYVRDLNHSRYPDIKGLDINLFRSQLDYLEEYYTFITIEELVHAIENDYSFPAKAVLLTFNDSYKDHFENVFPLLDERGIQGCFYPEIAAIEEQKVLINHKLHFILAAAKDSASVKHYIFSILENLRNDYALHSNGYYFDKLAQPSEYDNKETIFVKRLLQTELEEEVRQKVTDQLFEHFVGIDEKVFSRELYLDRNQIQCMLNHGMHFGILGYHHRRYDTLSREGQKHEITRSKDFLIEIGVDELNLTASYPWGAYNQDTLDILKEINCKAAFTTHAGIADIENSKKLELSRLDTNEMPKSSDAEPNHWYAEA